ncbi:hypothetical protein Q3G72_004760 [Acer saccharum]|nr:hypothetical protein Q3G72_004760 [Acer saccharum]
MKRWLPRGFGEDKVYDTSIEEKLLQEIEQSREAQIANVNKLKNDPLKTNPNKEKQKHLKLFQVVFVYIPRKKNIHRDLKSAFEDFRGIINISPAVSGNKKMLIVKWQRSLKISSNYDRLLEMFQPFRQSTKLSDHRKEPRIEYSFLTL